jgi:predicted metalloprotease with PDZ domain
VPDRKVSVYHKGALVALLLDLTLRQLSNHKRSLDDVMRRLWTEFGQTGVGYTEEDYTRIVKEVAGRDMQAYFDKFIYGTASLEEPLNRVLSFVGCRLKTEESLSASESIYGFRTVVKNDRPQVTNILPDAPAALALTVDDEIVAVNGRRVSNNLHTLLSDGGAQHEVTVFRQNRLLTVPLVAEPGHLFWQTYTIEKLPLATPEQQASHKQWLKQDF